MALTIQPSFAKGELGPELYGRVDTAAYQVGLRTARNVVIHTHGGVSNRTGLRFIAPVKDHTNRPVLLDFQFKATDTYVLEFGNLYMRVIRNDTQVLEATKTITGATVANPVVVTTSAAHGYINGDHVFIEAVAGMTDINARWFIVANKTATTFELTDPYNGGGNIDGTAFTAYTSGGTVGKVYEISTPYVQTDLPDLSWTQSADVMTITHENYPIKELTRTGHNAWTLTEPTFAPLIAAPTTVGITVNGADNNIYWKYKVTAVKNETLEESLSGLASGLTVASATAANPVVVTITAHGLQTGDEIKLTGFTQMTEVNDRRFIITKDTANTFSLQGEDGSGYTAETTGGANTCFPAFVGTGTAASPTGTTIPDNTITWDAVADAKKYTIYRAKGGSGGYGFLAETQELTFADDSTAEKLTDLDITPPQSRNPFRVAGDYPGAVGYYQQRRTFGGSINSPDTSEYSKTGNQDNFSKSTPLQADDAISVTLNSRQVNQIRHFIPGKDLIILTDGSEWRVNSGDNSGFSAETLRQQPQTNWGASRLKPIIAGKTILYVQENGIAIRSLGYQLSIDGYDGTDLNLLAPHIFAGTTITSWGFTRSPDPVAYVVRSDGNAATMTFDPDQKVLAWTRWDTLGKFKWVLGMRPSATDINDAAYFVIERTINGNTVVFIERTADSRFDDLEDHYYVDCGLTLDNSVSLSGVTAADPVVVTTATSHGFSDGDEVDFEEIQWTPQFDAWDNETNPDQINKRRYFIADSTATTMTLFSNENGQPITDITQANPGVVTSAAHTFVDGDIIAMNGIAGMVEANNNIYKVASATANTFELNTVGGVAIDTTGFSAYTAGGNIHHATDGSAFKAYVSGGEVRKTVLTVSGLDHLEGETVIMLADGNAVSGKQVSGGSVTLDRKASRVHVGLKYISDIETLNIETTKGTIQGRVKKIPKVTIRFKDSRGLLIGPSSSELVEMKQRSTELLGQPTQLLTGDKEIYLKPSWNSNGRLFMRQNNPLPMTILAVIPDIEVGET